MATAKKASGAAKAGRRTSGPGGMPTGKMTNPPKGAKSARMPAGKMR